MSWVEIAAAVYGAFAAGTTVVFTWAALTDVKAKREAHDMHLAMFVTIVVGVGMGWPLTWLALAVGELNARWWQKHKRAQEIADDVADAFGGKGK